MLIAAKPGLARACQLARSGACASMEELHDRLAQEGLDPGAVISGPDIRRMLRGLIRQQAAVQKTLKTAPSLSRLGEGPSAEQVSRRV